VKKAFEAQEAVNQWVVLEPGKKEPGKAAKEAGGASDFCLLTSRARGSASDHILLEKPAKSARLGLI